MGNADLPHLCGRREPKSKGVYPPANAGFIPSHDGKVVFKAGSNNSLLLFFEIESLIVILSVSEGSRYEILRSKLPQNDGEWVYIF